LDLKMDEGYDTHQPAIIVAEFQLALKNRD
jgi:hypothetical protein